MIHRLSAEHMKRAYFTATAETQAPHISKKPSKTRKRRAGLCFLTPAKAPDRIDGPCNRLAALMNIHPYSSLLHLLQTFQKIP